MLPETKQNVADTCAGESPDTAEAFASVASGLPVHIGSTRVSVNRITDGTDRGELLLEDGATADIDLNSRFALDRIVIRVSRVGDDLVSV
jgi:hypothetical protein